MLREFVIICAAAIVCNSPLHIAAESPSLTLVAVKDSTKADQSVAEPQDNDALPSESSYESVVPQSLKYLPPGSYEGNAAVVQTLPDSVPVVASSSVSVQANGPSYTNQPINPYYSVPVAAKTITINQAAGNAVYSNNLDPSVRQYYVVPLAANTVESLNPSGNYVRYGQNVYAPTAFANNAGPPKQYYSAPVAANKVSIESHGAVNVHPPTSYAVQPVQPNVALSAQSPALVKYSVNHEIKPQVAQYVAAPTKTYAANPAVKIVPISSIPVASKKVTVEAYNSVTAHPPPAPKYATGPALIRYGPGPIPVDKPIPVPVIYQASAVETNHPAVQPFAVPTASTYNQTPIKAQPVLVNIGNGAVRYNPVPIPRVYAESFVEKVYTPAGQTLLTPAGTGNSYAKAVVFSPASEVSRVTFNGLGTSYGW